MSDTITVTGAVGNDPRLHVTSQGLAITSFRLASTRRYFDRAKGAWEDGETNWYTVSGFRQLANNAATSIRKGDRVVVHGRLRLRAWDNGEKSGTAIEIEAEAIGHDLSWGTTVLTKVRRESTADAEAAAPADSNAWPGSEGVAPPAGLGMTAPDLDDVGTADEVGAEESQAAVAV
jgi:single-strand DNA-binding protein